MSVETVSETPAWRTAMEHDDTSEVAARYGRQLPQAWTFDRVTTASAWTSILLTAQAPYSITMRTPLASLSGKC